MNKFQKLSMTLTAILLLLAVLFIQSLFSLNILPGIYHIPALILTLLAIAILGSLQLWYVHVQWAKTAITAFAAFCILLCGMGTWYTLLTSDVFQQVTRPQTFTSNTVMILVPANSPIQQADQLENQTVGILENQNLPQNACFEALEKKDIAVQTDTFENLTDLASALYDGTVPAVMMTRSNLNLLINNGLAAKEGTTPARFAHMETDTRVVFDTTYSIQQKKSTTAVSNILKTPFTVLITGSDSREGFEEVGRSDVNMVVTVNPQTHTILLTSIPRDYYIPTVCDAGQGCLDGQNDKLTHTGVYGKESTKNTIEQLLSLDINYTLEVNFDTVINLVNALGGIDIYVEPGKEVAWFYTKSEFGLDAGWHHVNGEEALAFARERYAYEDGDLQRIRNQQQVLEAIFDKLKSPSILVSYPRIMDAIAGAFITDLTPEDIQSLIQYQLKEDPEWHLLTNAVEGTSAMDWSPALGTKASVMVPDYQTVNQAIKEIRQVLEGKKT